MPAHIVPEQGVYDRDVFVYSHVFVPAGTKLSDVFFPRVVVAGDIEGTVSLMIRFFEAVQEDRAATVQD